MRKQDKQHRKVRKYKAGPNFSGQHLMHNKGIIKDLIRMAELKRSNTVLEIGAGKGALTFPLAEKAGKVIAVEYDSRFIEGLRRKAEGYSNIKILERDILQVQLPKETFCVVANIPYSITTPILEKLLQQPNALDRAILVMEEGAAKRFTARPITNPRILAWRMWFDLELVRRISRDNFSPPPRVDSAALRIRRKSKCILPVGQYSKFEGLAEYALKYPQWPISEALKNIFTQPQMKHLIKNLRVERDTPICCLTEEQWGVVFNTMLQYVEPFRWPAKRKKRNN